MTPTEIIGNHWFSVGFYSVFCFWALDLGRLGLWFFFLKFYVWAFFLMQYSRQFVFGHFWAFCSLFYWAFFQKPVLALFRPLLGTHLGPVRGLLYFGHFWAFLHIHKAFYNLLDLKHVLASKKITIIDRNRIYLQLFNYWIA